MVDIVQSHFGIVMNNIIITDDNGNRIAKVHVTARGTEQQQRERMTDIVTRIFAACNDSESITVTTDNKPQVIA
jgi:hypothetical protein